MFLNEASLCEKLQSRNPDTFTYLYNAYSRALYAEIFRIIRNRESAEDLLQEVFISVWQKGYQFNPAKGRLYTWLIYIARNRCIDHLRKAGRTVEIGNDNHYITDNSQAENILELSVISKSIRNISKRNLELIRLIYFYGYSHVEAAEKCRIPVGTVKTTVRKIISKSRDKYQIV